MTVRKTRPISIYIDASTKQFLEDEAGRRRLDLSSLCMKLIAQGLAMDSIERATGQMKSLIEGDVQRALLKQVLATRYIVEAQAKGEIKIYSTVGTDAEHHAERELKKIWPKASAP